MRSALRPSLLALVPVVLSATCSNVQIAPPCGRPGIVIECTESKDCPESYLCDYGYCFQPTQEACMSDADCKTKGTTCLVYAAVCVVGGASCTSDAECASAQVCDSSGICVLTRACTKNADCGSGALCGPGGVCVLDCGS